MFCPLIDIKRLLVKVLLYSVYVTLKLKEIEKRYNLFYDNMIKCYGYCDMSYYEFKKCICCYTINKYNETLKNVKNSQKS